MAKPIFQDTVSVSFHYFEKGTWLDGGLFQPSELTLSEFEAIIEKITNQPKLDLDVANDFDSLKFGKVVPIPFIEKIDQRTYFGTFTSAYWGHAFENTDKGKIPAASLNLRDFCFLMYFAENGRIYLGCQYLGNYGDYTAFSKLIIKSSELGKHIRSSSIHSDFEDFKNTVPTEVRISLNSKNSDITGKSVFNSGSMLAFKSGGRGGEFELGVREHLLAMLGQPKADIKKQVAYLLSKNQSFSIPDDQIEDCVVTVRKIKGKGTKSIYLFGNGNRATRFHLDVKLDSEGLPIINFARKAMLDKLEVEIISKVMDG